MVYPRRSDYNSRELSVLLARYKRARRLEIAASTLETLAAVIIAAIAAYIVWAALL